MSRLSYREEITLEELRSLLNYEPSTGFFTWIKKPSQGVSIGDSAGSKTSTGYRSIRIGGINYQAHRLAWFHHHGQWPENDVDHINGDRSDNRIANLRDVSRSVNLENLRLPRSDNKSGFLGVSWAKKEKKWKAQIKHKGRVRSIGYFSTPEQAHEAYLSVKREVHSGCTL